MKKIVSMILTLTLMLMMITGCSSKEYIMKVDGKNVAMGEAVFLLREMETMYEAGYGSDIWKAGTEGQTFSEMAKSTTLDTLKRLYLSTQIAEEKGIELSDDEKEQLETEQDEVISNYSETQLKEDHISEEDIKNVYYYNAIVEKFMEEELADFTIDQEKLEADLAEDTNYQYIQKYGYEGVMEQVTVQHILIRTVNDDGEDKTDEEKQEALKLATEVLALVKKGDVPFEELVSQYSEDQQKESNLGKLTFQKGLMVQAFEEAAFNMAVGDISDLVLSEYGYHIIKKLDHIYPTEEEVQKVMEYESGLKEQYELKQKQEEFNNRFAKWEEDHTIEVDEEAWKSILTTYEKNNLKD